MVHMDSEKNIPQPDPSGIEGSQIKENDSISLVETKPFEGLQMAKTIQGLAISHARSLGGEVTSALIAGATRQIANDYEELKQQYYKLNLKYETQRDKLEEIRIDKAVLSEKISADGRNKNLRNLSITIGTSLFGTGIFLSKTELDLYAYGAYGFGLLLLLLGWFSGSKENK
jgi:hypothetical protein